MTLAPLLLLVACANEPASSPGTAVAAVASASQPGAVDVAGLKAVLDKGPATVIDVRTREEFALGHVPGAVNIPIDELEGRVSELETWRDQDLYLICAVGGRSAAATSLLTKQGFTRPINVTGGTNSWQSAGYPLQ